MTKKHLTQRENLVVDLSYHPDQQSEADIAAAHREEKREYRSKYYAEHKDELKSKHKAQYRANPGRFRNWQLLRDYGITLEQYNEMLKSQDYRCAICGTDNPGGRGAFHVDHNHITGKVRGLLCSSCNHAIGLLKVDEHGSFNTRKATEYINKYNGDT